MPIDDIAVMVAIPGSKQKVMINAARNHKVRDVVQQLRKFLVNTELKNVSISQNGLDLSASTELSDITDDITLKVDLVSDRGLPQGDIVEESESSVVISPEPFIVPHAKFSDIMADINKSLEFIDSVTEKAHHEERTLSEQECRELSSKFYKIAECYYRIANTELAEMHSAMGKFYLQQIATSPEQKDYLAANDELYKLVNTAMKQTHIEVLGSTNDTLFKNKNPYGVYVAASVVSQDQLAQQKKHLKYMPTTKSVKEENKKAVQKKSWQLGYVKTEDVPRSNISVRDAVSEIYKNLEGYSVSILPDSMLVSKAREGQAKQNSKSILIYPAESAGDFHYEISNGNVKRQGKLSSSNPKHSAAIESISSRRCMRKIKSALNIDNNELNYSANTALAKSARYGNCGLMSHVFISKLENITQRKLQQSADTPEMKVELVSVNEFDHAVVLINRDPKSDLSKPETWNCLIADPWRGGKVDTNVYHSSEFTNKMLMSLPYVNVYPAHQNKELTAFSVNTMFSRDLVNDEPLNDYIDNIEVYKFGFTSGEVSEQQDAISDLKYQHNKAVLAHINDISLAVWRRDTNNLEKLLENPSKTVNYDQLIQLAIDRGASGCLEKLLQNQDNYAKRFSYLVRAAGANQGKCVDVLIKAGIDFQELNVSAYKRKTLIKRCSAPVLASLFEKEVFSQETEKNMLQEAVETYNSPCLELLIQRRDADDSALQSELNQALDNSLTVGAVKCALVLLKHGGEINPKFIDVAIENGFEDNNFELALELVSKYSDQIKDTNFLSEGMFKLVESNNAEMVEQLLQYEFDLNIADKDGNSCLFNALRDGNFEMCALLQEAGAELKFDSTKVDCEELIKMLANSGEKKMMKLFVDALSPETKNTVLPKVMVESAINKNYEMIEALLSVGVDIDAKFLGKSAIYEVCESTSKEIDTVKFLVEHGADVNQNTETGESLLLMAISRHKFDIGNYLKDKGANMVVPANYTADKLILLLDNTDEEQEKFILMICYAAPLEFLERELPEIEELADSDFPVALHALKESRDQKKSDETKAKCPAENWLSKDDQVAKTSQEAAKAANPDVDTTGLSHGK